MTQFPHETAATTRELPFELPDHVPAHNEGRTLASIVTMIGIVLGTLVATVGTCFAQPWIAVVGLAVVGIALLTGWFLRSLGYGQHHTAR